MRISLQTGGGVKFSRSLALIKQNPSTPLTGLHCSRLHPSARGKETLVPKRQLYGTTLGDRGTEELNFKTSDFESNIINFSANPSQLVFCKVSKISFIPTKMLGEQWTNFSKVGRNCCFLFQSTECGMFNQSVKLKLLTISSFRFLSVVAEHIPIVSTCNWSIAWPSTVSWH